jgi:tetratricopeptide (TPR) repeat protein
MEKAQGMLDAYESLRAQGRIVEVAPLYGDLLMTMGRWDEAIELFEESLAPNDGTVRGMLIEAFSQAGRYEKAQALAQQEFDIRQAQVKGMSGGRISLKARAALRLSTHSIDFGAVDKGTLHTRTRAISNIGTDVLADDGCRVRSW